jgi:hypothetical protein
MTIKPEDLLACAEAMTSEQRARFCELIDPAHPDVIEAEIDATLNPFLESGVQGPPKLDKYYDEVTGEYCRDLGPHHLFRPPSPELLARFLYKQMTHKELVVAAPKGVQPDDDMMANMKTVVVTRQDIVDRDRWMKARERWEKLFGEAQIPIIRDLKNMGTTLDLVEAVLYDKEHKNQDPTRCSCGCGYVAGCGVNGFKEG